jgi:hypothetical protein
MKEYVSPKNNPIVLILVMITMITSAVFGIKLITDWVHNAEVQNLERLKKEQVECFNNPIYVGVMPDGRVINKILYPNHMGTDTIYFYTNPDGSIDSTINYGDKMRRNSPQFQPSK